MTIRAGELRHKIQILVPVDATDSFADNQVTFVPGPIVWANIRPLEGRTLWYAQQKRADASHQVQMRFRNDVTARHRFSYHGRTFEFGPPLNQDELDYELNLIAVEILT